MDALHAQCSIFGSYMFNDMLVRLQSGYHDTVQCPHH